MLEKTVNNNYTVDSAEELTKLKNQGIRALTLDDIMTGVFSSVSGPLTDNIPFGYAGLNGLKSVNGAYINIPYNIGINTGIMISFDYQKEDVNTTKGIFGNPSFGARWYNKQFRLGVNISLWDNINVEFNEINNILEMSNDGCYFNGKSIHYVKGSTFSTYFNVFTYDLHLFTSANVRRFVIYESNKVVKDLRTVIRLDDSALGMIDIISNVFYTNVGSGSFIYDGSIYLNNNDKLNNMYQILN